jgi:predicted nucleotidyltransferase
MLEHTTMIDLKILSLYVRDYASSYSIREMSMRLKINYSHAFKRINELVKNGYLIKKKKGHSNVLSLNITNYETIKIMNLAEQLESNKIRNNTLMLLIQEAMRIDIYACIGLFGSRVSGKAEKDSDWDIFIITTKRKEMEKIMSKFPYAKNIQVQVFTSEEFWESLISQEETVVKHIIRNKQIIYNPYPFYHIIRNWELTKYAPSQTS